MILIKFSRCIPVALWYEQYKNLKKKFFLQTLGQFANQSVDQFVNQTVIHVCMYLWKSR